MRVDGLTAVLMIVNTKSSFDYYVLTSILMKVAILTAVFMTVDVLNVV
jgi:hypothetical protein